MIGGVAVRFPETVGKTFTAFGPWLDRERDHLSAMVIVTWTPQGILRAYDLRLDERSSMYGEARSALGIGRVYQREDIIKTRSIDELCERIARHADKLYNSKYDVQGMEAAEIQQQVRAEYRACFDADLDETINLIQQRKRDQPLLQQQERAQQSSDATLHVAAQSGVTPAGMVLDL